MAPAIILALTLLHGAAPSAAAALRPRNVSPGYAYYEQGENGDTSHHPAGDGSSPGGRPNTREIVTIAAVAGGVAVSILWFVWWRLARDRAGHGSRAGPDATGAAAAAAEPGDAGAGGGAGAGADAGAGGGRARPRGSHGGRGEDDNGEVYGNTTVITAGPDPFRDPPDCDKPLPQDKPLPPSVKEDGEGITTAAVRPGSPEGWVGPVGTPLNRGGEQHEIVSRV